MLQRHPAVGLSLAMALTVMVGCESHTPPQSGSLAIPIARLQTAGVATLSGLVTAPVGLQPRDWRIAAIEEAPLAGARVVLADLAGTPLPGVAAVMTDANGRYRFGGVPVGRTLLVWVEVESADGAPLRLMTLVTTREAELEAHVSAGTTALTAATLRRTGAATGPIDAVAFTEAASLLDQVLTASDATRLEDPDLLATGAMTLEDLNCELQLAVSQVLQDPTLAGCTPPPSPTPTPRRGSGGGGSSGGGSVSAPTVGSLQADIAIQDGPVMAISPTPTPTP